MLYIVLTIIVSVLLLIIFKLFDKYKVNTFEAIVVNYITAAITGILFANSHISVGKIVHAESFFIAFPMGFVFISIFYLISQTAQKIGISTASISNKLSVVIPVAVSMLVFHEKLNPVKTTGVIAALLAVFLTVYSKKEGKSTQNLWWLPVLVFIGSGLIDSVLGTVNRLYVHSEADSEVFTVSCFSSAFCVGICILIFLVATGRMKLDFKSLIAGICLGIPNYFSIFFILKSLDSHVLSDAALFPVLNISNVGLSALLGALLFREKLSKINLVGLTLAVLAIVLIAV